MACQMILRTRFWQMGRFIPPTHTSHMSFLALTLEDPARSEQYQQKINKSTETQQENPIAQFSTISWKEKKIRCNKKDEHIWKA